MNVVWQTRTELLCSQLNSLPSWKQTAKDTEWCVSSEITHLVSICSRARTQIHKLEGTQKQSHTYNNCEKQF